MTLESASIPIIDGGYTELGNNESAVKCSKEKLSKRRFLEF